MQKRKKGRRRRKRKEEEGKKRGSVSREGDREDGGAGEKPLASRPWNNEQAAGYLKRRKDMICGSSWDLNSNCSGGISVMKVEGKLEMLPVGVVIQAGGEEAVNMHAANNKRKQNNIK